MQASQRLVKFPPVLRSRQGETCQYSVLSIEGEQTTNVSIYNLNTIGAESMIWRDHVSLADYIDIVDVFPCTLPRYHYCFLRLD